MREENPLTKPAVPAMRAQDYSEVQDWPGYFGAVLGKPPRETLVAALDSRICGPGYRRRFSRG